MSNFSVTWPQADPSATGQYVESPPPDGVHVAGLQNASAFTSRNGSEVLVLEWAIADGEYQWSQVCGFRSQAAANVTAAQVQALGFTPSEIVSLDHLDATVKQVVGRYYRVQVSRSGQYVNTMVEGQAQPPEGQPLAQQQVGHNHGAASPVGHNHGAVSPTEHNHGANAQPAAHQQQLGAQAAGWPQHKPANAIHGDADIPF